MIFVFKTSVKSKVQIRKLKPFIEQSLPRAKWNFDLQDRDNILRIDHESDVSETVKSLLHSLGFTCEELE